MGATKVANLHRATGLGIVFLQRYAVERICALSVLRGHTAQVKMGARSVSKHCGYSARWTGAQLRAVPSQGGFSLASAEGSQVSALSRASPCRHTRQRIFSKATHPGVGYSLSSLDSPDLRQVWVAWLECAAQGSVSKYTGPSRHTGMDGSSFSFSELCHMSTIPRKFSHSPQPTPARQVASVVPQIMLPDENSFCDCSIFAQVRP